jgi:hypothetical protein
MAIFSASDYKGANKINVKHPSLIPSDPCPLDLCTGRVYLTKKPGNIIRIVGSKRAGAKHYILEKLRCNVYGALFSATSPIAGAALDNDCCEEILKIPIKIRKKSAFFATLHGAFVSSMLISLIVTAARADVNPVEYLTALQQYKT